MYVRFEDDKKNLVKQEGTNWAIRKPMHKDTVFGEVNLRKIKVVSLNEAIKNPSRIVEKEFKAKLSSLLMQGYDAKKVKKYFETNKDVWQDINLSKIAVYYFTKETNERFFATRKAVVDIFNGVTKKDKAVSIIESITDLGIRSILLKHLEIKGDDPQIAFSPDGIDEMNRNIVELNGGKCHQPILKVRVYEKAEKFAIGQKGNKSSKFVEAAKGTNLYFAVYETETLDEEGKVVKKRSYVTIPLNVVMERLKQGLSPAPTDENGNEPKFILSPNDLVYVPDVGDVNDSIDYNRIYKFVSCTGNEAHFIPCFIASPIIETKELGSNNKAQRAWTNEMIKEVCMPVKVDRLGRIIKLGY